MMLIILFFIFCVSIVPSSNDFPKPNLIAHPCAKAPLCETQSFCKAKGRICEMQMRNASEILRNTGGVGESISQNSLRVLWDFFGGAGGIK